jgi:DNA primase
LRGEFDEEVLRESGLFSWKEEGSRQATATSPQQNARSLDPVRDDKSGRLPPTANDQRPTAAMYSKFRNRVMFPIANEAGRVIAFTARTLSTDEKAGPKYLNSPETAIYSKSRMLFNLDQAKEAIRKLDYAILVEGQMDCIAVYAAGFHNVIASSGTAFTELQARLLGRFTRNVVVNFDPDTAGAKATERTLGLLVEEEFQVKVLTLESGFDPDLYIRRKGKEAYAVALKNSQKYFDYLIERARAQFPVRSAEGKVKAVNYLLPHIQRIPSRIARDELAREMAQKLGIDSSVLRQELKHAASIRSTATLKTRVEVQVTDAEKILIRALASATEVQMSEEHVSARDGADEEFIPCRQAQFALTSEGLHVGLATESLIETLLRADVTTLHITELPLPEADRALLASVLMKDDEELTPERLDGAVRGLRRIQLRRKLERVQTELQTTRGQESSRMQALLQEKMRLKRALMDPSLADEGPAARPA